MITINLLPPSIKSSREFAKKNRILLRFLTYYVGMLLILYVILLGVVASITLEKNNLVEEIKHKETEVGKFAEIEKSADNLTKRLDTINRVFGLRPNWKKLVEEIANRRPNGVTVTRIAIDAREGSKVSVQASGSLYNLTLFREALDESQYFDYVEFENLGGSPGSYSTNFSFELAKGALK